MATRSQKARQSGELALLSHNLKKLAEEARNCGNCDLWRNATQTVFGEGSPNARIMLIGEAPGRDEDEQGLEEVGIEMKGVYLMNAVKHFKWERRGKRRIHKKPSAGEMNACKPWLNAEIAAVKPQVIVCLGATAAQTLLGRSFRVTQHRGEFLESTIAPYVMATVHPSAILRARDEDSRHEQERQFLADLKKIAAIRV